MLYLNWAIIDKKDTSMRKFNKTKYSFESRKDMLDSLNDILAPLENFFIRNNTRIHISNTGANDSTQDLTDFEHFSRILWGLIPAGNESTLSSIWEKVIEGIENGVNPQSEDYFGEPESRSQILVEMAAFAYGLIINKKMIYDPLSEEAKANLIGWLKKANDCEYYECNWKMFNVLVNLGLDCVGEAMDKDRVKKHLDEIDSYYFGDGWYYDGKPGNSHADYYVPFAIHFYSLIYVKQMRERDKERCERYEARAREFAQSFTYWFSPDGSALPYGRSLNYRFAQVAFFCAAVYAGVDLGMDMGIIKGIILRHLRYWFAQPIFNASGHLALGYIYTNMNFPEGYMAPGSPYWALKAYLILALDESDEFWKAEEMPLPDMKDIMDFEAPCLRVARKAGSSHILAYNCGNMHTNEHNHTEAKYEKFVYSNIFGFSVSRSNVHLRHGAYDNMLAIADEYGYYRAKRKSIELHMYRDYLYTRWSPYSGVNIDTYIVAGNPGHIRIHVLDADKYISAAEGGFALGLEMLDKNRQIVEYKINGNSIIAIGEQCYSAAYNLYGYDDMEFVFASANTNSQNPRTAIPTLIKHIETGRHILISYIAGDSHQNYDWQSLKIPEVKIEADGVLVVWAERSIKVLFEN